MPEATAFADHALALESKIDLSKPGRARLLRRLGKRTGRGATDKREFGNSVRDLGSLPPAQARMGARAGPQRAAQSLRERARASSPVAGTTRHRPFETAQLRRLGAAAFSDRMRSLAPSPWSAYQDNSVPFATSRPAYRARTANHAAGLRRA